MKDELEKQKAAEAKLALCELIEKCTWIPKERFTLDNLIGRFRLTVAKEDLPNEYYMLGNNCAMGKSQLEMYFYQNDVDELVKAEDDLAIQMLKNKQYKEWSEADNSYVFKYLTENKGLKCGTCNAVLA